MSIENDENYTGCPQCGAEGCQCYVEEERRQSSRMAKIASRMPFPSIDENGVMTWPAHTNARDPFEGGQLYERERITKMLEKLIDERSGVNLQGALALIKEMKI
jgi:hypothetical protein